MFRIGSEEVDALAKVIQSRKLFRYVEGSECERFEQRYARYLGVGEALMTSSGSAALVAALAGLGVGPGDEVIVPAHTFMATAVAVLAVGAIPVIVDVDESITLSPEALENAIGPRTKAVIPVHMWGLPCNMNRIMEIAHKRHLLVVEDACQGVGGAYEGRKLGSIGHAGAFSFNYFKNMTCGEGGAVVSSDPRVMQVARCSIDCCSFFWKDREQDIKPFSANGSRASELEGAIMSVQLDRIEETIAAMRQSKKQILRQTTGHQGLQASITHSPDWECGTKICYLLPTATAAEAFVKQAGGVIAAKTGRHTYNEWDPILNHRAGHVPAMNPFLWEQNKGCRMNYSLDMCAPSLGILGRTVMIDNNPDRTAAEIDQLINRIRLAGEVLLAQPVG
jgi:dTDP-4-amino-4,6-dideoxygalactose transaminase